MCAPGPNHDFGFCIESKKNLKWPCPPTASVAELVRDHYALEWVSARLHFLSGVLMFVLGVGIRAWVTIGCPVIAKAALGIVLSASLLCAAFLQDLQDNDCNLVEGLIQMPLKYLRLLAQRARKKPLFAVALAVSIATNLYLVGSVPHVVRYLQGTM